MKIEPLDLHGLNNTHLQLYHHNLTLPKKTRSRRIRLSSKIHQNRIKTGAGSTPKHHVDKVHAKKTVCFRCQGHVHVAKKCPNRFLITREDHILYMQQGDAYEPTADDDIQTPNAYPESEGNMLLTHQETNTNKQDSLRSVSSSSFTTPRFNTGELVVLHEDGEDKYFAQPYAPPLEGGPYRVHKLMGKGRYKVMLSVNNNFTFHATKLLPYNDYYPP